MVAFNTSGVENGRRWGNGTPLAYTCKNEVHHYEHPFSRNTTRPWKNSRRVNMVVWTKKAHRRWHALPANRQVPFMDD